MNDDRDLIGLGGWLILVGIGVVLIPLRLLITVLPPFISLFSDGTWEAVTTEGSTYYHSFWAPLLITEMIVNIGLFIVSLYLVFLFFSKHRLFPITYVLIAVVTLIFIPLDAWLTTYVLPDEPIFDPDTIRNLTQAFVSSIIWIPYMMTSKRVKNTFGKVIEIKEADV